MAVIWCLWLEPNVRIYHQKAQTADSSHFLVYLFISFFFFVLSLVILDMYLHFKHIWNIFKMAMPYNFQKKIKNSEMSKLPWNKASQFSLEYRKFKQHEPQAQLFKRYTWDGKSSLNSTNRSYYQRILLEMDVHICHTRDHKSNISYIIYSKKRRGGNLSIKKTTTTTTKIIALILLYEIF